MIRRVLAWLFNCFKIAQTPRRKARNSHGGRIYGKGSRKYDGPKDVQVGWKWIRIKKRLESVDCARAVKRADPSKLIAAWREFAEQRALTAELSHVANRLSGERRENVRLRLFDRWCKLFARKRLA